MKFYISKKCLLVAFICFAANAQADPLPGPADIDRIKPEERIKIMQPKSFEPLISEDAGKLVSKAPKGSDKVRITIKTVEAIGSSVYRQDELAKEYRKYLGKETTLDKVWLIADKITALYRKDGYFLTRAYVPAQEVEDGEIIIKIIEGYVGKVNLDDSGSSNSIVQKIIARIESHKPLKMSFLEEQLLLLNDLPMFDYKATLEPLDSYAEGAVQLTFHSKLEKISGLIVFDNMGSRYLGPHEVQASAEVSLAPLQKTNVSGLVSAPTDELNSLALEHTVTLAPELLLTVRGSRTMSSPGYLLEKREVESVSKSLGLELRYQPIRQRQENLELRIGLDGRNSESEIANLPLSEDKIRALRLKAHYENVDDYNGYNIFNFALSKGIAGLGSSDAGATNASRANAVPDFIKTELYYARLQNINDGWSALLAASAQKTTDSLYSSEEFGYGGIAFGRAYDASEISGDSGLAGSLELRYNDLPEWESFTFMPYGFYDIGKVWNNNLGQVEKISGASTGLGLRFFHSNGLGGNFLVAAPLTKTVDSPVYGASDSGIRYLFQLDKSF